jgi:hypothetical protein
MILSAPMSGGLKTGSCRRELMDDPAATACSSIIAGGLVTDRFERAALHGAKACCRKSEILFGVDGDNRINTVLILENRSQTLLPSFKS